MSKQIRIAPAAANPDTEVKITMPYTGRHIFIRNDFLLPLADKIADYVEYGRQ